MRKWEGGVVCVPGRAWPPPPPRWARRAPLTQVGLKGIGRARGRPSRPLELWDWPPLRAGVTPVDSRIHRSGGLETWRMGQSLPILTLEWGEGEREAGGAGGNGQG